MQISKISYNTNSYKNNYIAQPSLGFRANSKEVKPFLERADIFLKQILGRYNVRVVGKKNEDGPPYYIVGRFLTPHNLIMEKGDILIKRKAKINGTYIAKNGNIVLCGNASKDSKLYGDSIEIYGSSAGKIFAEDNVLVNGILKGSSEIRAPKIETTEDSYIAGTFSADSMEINNDIIPWRTHIVSKDILLKKGILNLGDIGSCKPKIKELLIKEDYDPFQKDPLPVLEDDPKIKEYVNSALKQKP